MNSNDEEGEPLTERATLHRVIRKVRPLPGHPLYWKIQFAFLNVWLYADSPGGAADTAEAIIALLPYERVGTQVAIYPSNTTATTERPPGWQGQSDETREQMDLRKELAAESGLSMMLIAVTVGADETDFEGFPMG